VKQNKEIPTFKDIMGSSIEESITESYANYGGTNVIGSVQGSSKNKYSPATVLKAPPLRYKNPDVTIGQGEGETKAPSPMIYPFESIFVELVELYSRLSEVGTTMDGAKTMATLSSAKQEAVGDAVSSLTRINDQLRKVIETIEELTI
jgi:hypothetical protein